MDSHEGLIRTQESQFHFPALTAQQLLQGGAVPCSHEYAQLFGSAYNSHDQFAMYGHLSLILTIESCQQKRNSIFLFFCFFPQADARFYRLKMNTGNFIWANQLFTSSLRVGTISYAPQNAHLLVRARDK